MLCRGPPRHRKGGYGDVTAHHTPVAAWPRTVKRSESRALSLGFMVCVLRMRPPECFLSIHPSIHWPEAPSGRRAGGGGGTKQRILGYRMPPCHRRLVIARNCSAALQHLRPVLNVALSLPTLYRMSVMLGGFLEG